MRLVLDTDVVVGALFWNGNERRLLLACLAGDHELVTSSALLAEAEDVRLRKFAYPKEDAADFLGALLRNATVVEPKAPLAVVREDPDDDRVLECAVEGGADLLVTGDRHLLRLGSFRAAAIVRPGEALRRLR